MRIICLAVVAGGMTDLAAHARGFGRLLRLFWLRPLLRLDHHLHHRCPEPSQLSPGNIRDEYFSGERGINCKDSSRDLDCSVLTYHSRGVCVRAIAMRESGCGQRLVGYLGYLRSLIKHEGGGSG